MGCKTRPRHASLACKRKTTSTIFSCNVSTHKKRGTAVLMLYNCRSRGQRQRTHSWDGGCSTDSNSAKLGKNFYSFVIWTVWSLWKQRNACVFARVEQQMDAQTLAGKILDEIKEWKLALGWPVKF
ncbi:hypothetical protein VPH35_096058 [Triticum aestivum]